MESMHGAERDHHDDETPSAQGYLGSRGRRILVVDDHEMVRVGLRALLATQPWVARCVCAGSVEEGVGLATRYEPHVALVDLFIGEQSGIDACRTLKKAHPPMNILLMSGVGTVSPAVAETANASGFIPKHWRAALLLSAVHRVADGLSVFAARPNTPAIAQLSPRELDVLRYVVQGLSNVEIGKALHLSRHTVKQHLSAGYRKLGVRNRTEAASRARQLGIS
jgi:DNA-binding NarL/FixJ family response regulator